MPKNSPVEPNELDLLTSFEKDGWQSLPDEEKLKLIHAAQKTLRKNKRINIRLAESTLIKLKTKALEEGIGYQTLIASVLHKYVGGRLKEVGQTS